MMSTADRVHTTPLRYPIKTIEPTLELILKRTTKAVVSRFYCTISIQAITYIGDYTYVRVTYVQHQGRCKTSLTRHLRPYVRSVMQPYVDL
jgi:hypothetical protein